MKNIVLILTFLSILIAGNLKMQNGLFLIKTKQPEIENFKVLDWGPRDTIKGKGFNIQPDGKSAIWIKVTEGLAVSNLKILFDENEMQDCVVTSDLITAAIEHGKISEDRHSEIYFKDAVSGKKYPIGVFSKN